MQMFSKTKRLDSERTYDVQFSLLHSLRIEHFATSRIRLHSSLDTLRRPSFGLTETVLICKIFSAPSNPVIISAVCACIIARSCSLIVMRGDTHTTRHRRRNDNFYLSLNPNDATRCSKYVPSYRNKSTNTAKEIMKKKDCQFRTAVDWWNRNWGSFTSRTRLDSAMIQALRERNRR